MKHYLPPRRALRVFRFSHFLFFAIAFIIHTPVLFAQQNITGHVSSNDTALAGITVRVRGTTTATQTDAQGNFRINALPNSTLQFSSIGFADLEVAVNNQTVVNANLQATSAQINDVVVIGYQTVRRKDLTGATAVVDTKNSGRIIGNSVAEQLQGQVPGVTVRAGGAPGQDATIEIRGVANFSGAQPLFVIDGMIADANSTVNTDDIATIQVLKDASAAAIYGSRAANGVIIITTKKGRSGPSVLTVSAKYGIQQIPEKWDVMGAPQYLKTLQTQYENSNAQLPAGIAAQIANPTINTDWQDAIYRVGNTQDYNIGISGGSPNGNYLISGSYFKNRGVLIGNNFERAALRINRSKKRQANRW